jgi:hypothetical protein
MRRKGGQTISLRTKPEEEGETTHLFFEGRKERQQPFL